jgi:branched-chain amino acid aminotransferase
LSEVFGCGTGAVISPVGELGHRDQRMLINGKKTGPMAQRLFDELTGIQQGRLPDTRGWLVTIA